MSDDKKYPVTEIFGPVIAGEGSLVGQQTIFLRLAGCDYRCSWCDTKYAVLPNLIKDNMTLMTKEEIYGKIVDLSGILSAGDPYVELITISGGNPAIHNLADVAISLIRAGYSLAIETQGTIWNDWISLCDHITVSPKPPSSGMETDWKQLEKFLNNSLSFTGRHSPVCKVTLKVVVFDDADYAYAKKVHKIAPALPFYIQPGTPQLEAPCTADDIRHQLLGATRLLIEQVCNDPDMRSVRVVPQMHSLLYGLRRGV